MKINQFDHIQFEKDMAFGALAGATAKTLIAPLDRGKILFQTSREPFSYSRLGQLLRGSVRSDGFFSLWRGNSAMMYRVLPYAALNFASHEQLKGVFTNEQNKNSMALKFALGSASGVIATTFTYPLDLARARLAVTRKSQFRNMFQIIRHSYAQQGIRALYGGYLPTVTGIMLYSGAGFAIFETLREYNEKNRSYAKTVAIGAVAGVSGQLLSYPVDILRRNLQVYDLRNHGQKITSFKQLLQIVYGGGGQTATVRRMYKAASLNLIKGPLAQGTAFSTFWLLRSLFSAPAAAE